MVLVDRTVAISAARVREVAAHGTLEETLAALARELAVVLSGALVATHDALDARLLGIVDIRRRRRRGTAVSCAGVSAVGVVVVGLTRVVMMVVVMPVAAAARRDGGAREGCAGGCLESVRRRDGRCPRQFVNHAARRVTAAPDHRVR